MSNVTPLNHETFDLAEALAGQNYPQEDIHVPFSHVIGYEIKKQSDIVKALELKRSVEAISQEDVQEAQDLLDEMIRDAADSLFTVTLRAVPRALRMAEREKAYAKYELETDMLGREKPNEKRDEMFTNSDWALHIIQIKDPSGRVLRDLDEKKAAYLRGNIPNWSSEKIGEAIKGFYLDSAEGFEIQAQETGFLSAASREA